MAFAVSSPAFADNGAIPKQYTCEGADISPPLNWSGAPQGTRSFALIVDDPDAPDPRAPKLTWVHWVVHNIPDEARGLPEDASGRGLPAGAVQGLNDWKRAGYGGPCPPVGRHRYFHKRSEERRVGKEGRSRWGPYACNRIHRMVPDGREMHVP